MHDYAKFAKDFTVLEKGGKLLNDVCKPGFFPLRYILSSMFVRTVSDISANTSQTIHSFRYAQTQVVILRELGKIFPAEGFHAMQKRDHEIGKCYKVSDTRSITKSGTGIALLGLSGRLTVAQ